MRARSPNIAIGDWGKGDARGHTHSNEGSEDTCELQRRAGPRSIQTMRMPTYMDMDTDMDMDMVT